MGSYGYGDIMVNQTAQLVDTARDLAFLSVGGTVEILSIANVYMPVRLSVIHTRGIITSLKHKRGKLYIATGRFGYEVWDISDPLNPSPVHIWNSPCGISKDIDEVKGFVVLSTSFAHIAFRYMRHTLMGIV